MMLSRVTGCVALLLFLTTAATAQSPPGEAPALGTDRITQADITGGGLTLQEVRAAGLKIFATPFNKLDGYGDGPVDPFDPTGFGHRPTLQGNGTFLRINGLDSQNCMECHSVGSNAVVPFRFAVGGVGGSNNNAMFMPTEVDVDDSFNNGFAFFNGRYINPPFLFGSGGIELLGKEMTADLQLLKAQAAANPGVPVDLVTKGVDFGEITYDAGARSFDTTKVEGVDADLVVRPFGRKGDNATVRQFDLDALQFHLGMQPVEVVGQGIDEDDDGVVDEILVGEVSALHIFNTNLERPIMDELTEQIVFGKRLFDTIGCMECHRSELRTNTRTLTYSFPEVHTDPLANVFYAADLAASPAGFDTYGPGGGTGLKVPLFSDLKRHDMGPGLAESFGSELDSEFITARLWGVADTAPYLHDGRATTLTEAIGWHDGEARAARDNWDALTDDRKEAVLSFLRALRTPLTPAADLLP